MISVIVCTHNRRESLKNTLYSLAQLRVPADGLWELIIVDNNSNDDTAEIVKDFAASARFCVRYILETNQGLSHARNAGVKAARSEIVAFTDDDVTVESHWLIKLQEAFEQFGCVGVGGRIVPLWSGPKPLWLRLSGPDCLRCGAIVSFDYGEKARECTTLFGANMAFKTVVFQRHGLFRTDLGKRGSDEMTGEDTEFCMRLSGAGAKLVYAPEAVVYHPVPKTRLKRHFQSHYFNYGRYTARLHGSSREAALWFGVPRYLLKCLAADLCRWLGCFDSQRFRHKLQVCESLGAVREASRMSRTSRMSQRSETAVRTPSGEPGRGLTTMSGRKL
jgi:glycosyltransferase involved in cell wall biosynthesis